MPVMGGPALVQRLRIERPHVKVLFVSGYTDDAIVRQGVLEPGVEFLQKPFALAALARRIREILGAGDGQNLRLPFDELGGATMLRDTAYGKSRVRLVQLARRNDRHDLWDLTIAMRFQGSYDESYTAGDNSAVLPTDTMRNTVYALAAQEPVRGIESFGLRLARHFLRATAA